MKSSWPERGEIRFKNVWLRYRPGLEHVLKGLNLSIKPGLKVGVVGRTGAGKSTLGLTLLRLMEVEKGNVFIDGVDIRKIDMATLRQKVTTIPQDPVLFKGTLRFNLDPHEKHADEQIDALLSRAGI